MSERSKRVGWGMMLLFSLAIVLTAAGPYLLFNPEHYFPQQRDVYLAHPFGIYLHLLGAMVALLIGPFQFHRSLRNRYVNLHRWLGRIYLLGVLSGGIGGLYMAFFSYGGFVTHLGFGSLAVWWLMTGRMAYKHIRNRQFQLHQEWMVRNFALTFAAVTLRIWLPLFIVLQQGELLPAYQAVSWFAWVPNLIIAEWIIKRLPPLPPTRTVRKITVRRGFPS